MEIVGEAENGRAALHFLQENPVDLMITDLSMPGLSGIDFLQTVRAVSYTHLDVYKRQGYTIIIGSIVIMTAAVLRPSEKDGRPTSGGMFPTIAVDDQRICRNSSCIGQSLALPRKRLAWNHSFQRPTA